MEKQPLMKNKKALAALAVLALLLVGYFTKEKWLPLFKKNAATTPTNGTTATNNTNSTNSSSGTSSNSTAIDKTVILKRGDNNNSVKELQRLINTKLNPPLVKLVEDGVFGAKTEAALLQVYGANIASINQFNAKFPTLPSVFTL